jgi:SEC-C motif-containing protein
MNKCPCGSQNDYDSCCGPYITGTASAPTAEALMRSRYTAYAVQAIDYIKQTTHKSAVHAFNEEASHRWSKESDWLGLEIRSVKGGLEGDVDGDVEFVATYTQNGADQVHHERATFKKEGPKWYFVDGELIGRDPFIRDTPKVGRNAPCPCGSGLKYKKCCAVK